MPSNDSITLAHPMTTFLMPTEKELEQAKELIKMSMETNELEETKPSNPKDLIGSNKVPYHFWPETATVYGAMACMYGNLQYGRTNWRAAGVRASIYYDALRRHMNAWFDAGEDIDSDSGLPHLAHALACIAIIIDADAAGKLNDDRMVKGGYRNLINTMTPHVARLKEKFKDKEPKHYSIKDNEVLDDL